MMERKTIAGLIATVVIVIAVVFAGCVDEEQVNTYNKFGFSFDYPADMDIVAEKGWPPFSEEANEEAGSLFIVKQGGPVLDIFWFPAEDVDRSFIWEMQGEYLAGRGKGYNFYLGDGKESKHRGHKVWNARFCIAGEEGVLLNVIGSWYCDRLKRVFTVSSGANWDDPQFSMTFKVGEVGVPKTEPEWPDLKKDPSYKTYKKIIDSFHCH